MSQIYLRTLSVWTVVTVMLPLAQTDWIMECKMCRCKWNSGKKTADCKNEELARVPIGLSNELQVLDLSNNFLPEIAPNEFATANLRNLHKLFIRNSTLKQIHRDSLKGLEILIELDLSYNLLKALPRIVFNNLVKLRVLMLNNNKLERLEDGLFRNLKFLHKIELKENQLVHIESKAFTILPVLTQIYLDGNQLTILNRECFQHLEKLTGLSLKQNPWNCTCKLRSFRDFAIEQNLYTPPTDCHYPEHLRGTLWTDVGLEAFACQPTILYPSIDEATISSYNENSTITCRIQASPNTAITWTYNRHALINYPKRIFIKNNSVAASGHRVDGGDTILTSELTIIGSRRTDEGIYTCSAKNAGGRAEIDIQLLIGRDNDSMLFLPNQMLFVLCLMVVGLLMISLIILVVTCCYCRKFKSIIKHDLDDGMSGVTGISIGADGTLNGTNSKKHLQAAIKLNSFNNPTMMIGNGSCIVTNATDCIDDGSIAMDVIVSKNGGISKIGNNDLEMDKFASIEFNRPSTKSDLILADAHYSNKPTHQTVSDKKSTDPSEIRPHQTVHSTSNSVILSPTRHQLYVSATDHASNNKKLQRLAVPDARLPPDLLSYGQHQQSLVLQSSLKNSSSSSTSSSTSTAILDHRIIQTSYNNGTNNISTNADRSSNRFPYNSIFCDEVSEHYHDNVDGNDDDDVEQLFLRQTPIEEPDLRIYHTDSMIKKASTTATTASATMPKYGRLNSSSPTMSSANITTTNKLSPAFPSYRSPNIYELTPASTILNTNYNNNTKYLNRPFNSNTLKTQPKTSSTTTQPNRPMDPNCKLRQSVVRTSPSFSFLPTGYNQQQDNFL